MPKSIEFVTPLKATPLHFAPNSVRRGNLSFSSQGSLESTSSTTSSDQTFLHANVGGPSVLPQFYRGNRGEVSPIRVRPKYMTRYTSLPLEPANNEVKLATLGADETIEEDDDDPDCRGTDTNIKTLYAHVLHRSRLSLNARKEDNHYTEDQLATWLEKIRRRKAYRSPFSALVPTARHEEDEDVDASHIETATNQEQMTPLVDSNPFQSPVQGLRRIVGL